MKYQLLIPAFFMLLITSACNNETDLSLLEQRKKELEEKKKELHDRKEIAALESELNNLDAEISALGKKGKQVLNIPPGAQTGTISGAGVVMRAANSVQSDKLANFSKGEQVVILNTSTSKAGNEAIASKAINLYKSQGSDEVVFTLIKGKALVIDAFSESEGVYNVHYQHPQFGTLYAIVPEDALEHLSGELWYFVRRSNGDKGWVTGRFLTVN